MIPSSGSLAVCVPRLWSILAGLNLSVDDNLWVSWTLSFCKGAFSGRKNDALNKGSACFERVCNGMFSFKQSLIRESLFCMQYNDSP